MEQQVYHCITVCTGSPELPWEGQATLVKVKNYLAFAMIQLNKHINSL